MSSYVDKKKRESKLKVMKDLGPPAPGGFTHESNGEEIPPKGKKGKGSGKKGKRKKEVEDLEIADAVPIA